MLKRLTEFLDQHGVRYRTIRHSPAFTAQEIAATAHVPGKEIAKTVIAKIDGAFSMIVVPASHMVDFSLVRKALPAHATELATEPEFKGLFPGCEAGAMPPFGLLFGIPVVADVTLSANEQIAFNAGNHYELIKMAYRDFERLIHPVLIRCAIRRRTREIEEDFLMG